MNDVVLRMIDSQALLFLYMLCGIVVSRAKVLTQDNRMVLVRLLMDLCVPMMVLNAFNRAYTKEELLSSLVIMGLSCAFCLLTGILGLLLFKRQPERRRHVLQYAVMFSNAGMAGLPVVSLVFGEVGVLYASMYMIPPRILQWTVGLGMFIRETGGQQKNAWVKNVLLNPVVVVVYIGFAMMLTGFTIPGVPARAIAGIGGMTAPLSMILLGATLAQMRPRMFLDKQVWIVTVLRLVLIPGICVLALFKTGIDPLILSVCATLLAMPAANNTATISERYGGDYVFASACVSVTTLLSVITVPLITWIIETLV